MMMLRETNRLLCHVAIAGSIAWGLIPSVASAQATPGPRRTDKADNPEIQRLLQNAHPGFRAFQAKHPGSWTAQFDERIAAPALIYGSGIPLGGRIGSMAAARQAAREVLDGNTELWGADLRYFAPAGEVKTGPLYVFTWKQQFDDLDVVGARIQIQIHESGRVAALAATGVAIPTGMNRTPALSTAQAEAAVIQKKRMGAADTVIAKDLVLFPVMENGVAVPRVAYVVEAEQPSVNIYEQIMVDGNTGAILDVAPLRYELDVKGKITGFANKELSGLGAPTEVPVEGATVTVPGLGSAVTDKDGNYTIPGTATVGGVVKVQLNGPLYTIFNAAGSNFGISASSGMVLNGNLIQDIVMNSVPTEFITSQITAATEVASVREYTESEIPSFVHFAGMPVTVNISSTCNAYYSAGTINFYAAGGACVNTCYSTVVYHEYGHAVDAHFGGISSGALSEALADILAMYMTDQPLVGQDFKGPGTIIRTGENTKSWPAANCFLEVHCVGETFMGFAWQALKKLKIKHGDAAGRDIAETIVLGTLPVDNNSIPDAVTQVFLLDDDDGDVTNGTPNYIELAAAAVMKGFTPPALKPIIVFHTSHPDTWNQTQPYLIYADVDFNVSTPFSIDVEYTLDGDATVYSVPMTPTAVPGQFRASIPPVAGPRVVSYVIKVIDQLFNFEQQPAGDSAFRFAVGRKTVLLEEDFEGGAPTFSHFATVGTDDWEVGTPQTAGTNLFDPKKAATGVKIAGTDLQMIVADNGLYAPNSDRWLETPTIVSTGYSGVRVRFKRWLTTETSQFDQAEIHANGNLIYQNPFSSYQFDSNWTTQDYPVAAANNPGFKVSWRMKSDNSTNYGGWSIDDVMVYAVEPTPVMNLTITPNSPTPYMGNIFSITASGTPGGYWELFASLGEGFLSVDGFGVVPVNPELIGWFWAGQMDASGNDILQFPMPYDPALAGLPFDWVAAVNVPGANWQISNTIRTVFQ